MAAQRILASPRSNWECSTLSEVNKSIADESRLSSSRTAGAAVRSKDQSVFGFWESSKRQKLLGKLLSIEKMYLLKKKKLKKNNTTKCCRCGLSLMLKI